MHCSLTTNGTECIYRVNTEPRYVLCSLTTHGTGHIHTLQYYVTRCVVLHCHKWNWAYNTVPYRVNKLCCFITTYETEHIYILQYIVQISTLLSNNCHDDHNLFVVQVSGIEATCSGNLWQITDIFVGILQTQNLAILKLL